MSNSDGVASLGDLRPALVRYLARYTGDPDLAEDLTQEAFVRLDERPPAKDTSLRGWLFTVATNLARDHGRVERGRRLLLATARHRVPVAWQPPDPATLAERADLRVRVRAALATLSEKERTALLLREEGFSHREIAEAVDTTTKSVGTLLARALAKASRHLRKEMDP